MSDESNPFRRTSLKLRICPEPMGRLEKSLWLGSCFTDNLGPWLAGLKYPVVSNPFGVVFHPLIMRQLLLAGEDDFRAFHFQREDVWLNFLLGTPFAAATENELDQQIFSARQQCREQLNQADWLVLTFGTAFLFHHRKLGPVGKCHKIPSSVFEKRMSTVEEISMGWESALKEIRKSNPGLRVILSLSPVRHSRDGLEENAISKATLRLAIEYLKTRLPGVYYFPAWEIMNDELRDYRFYGSDLVHPSEEAILYLKSAFEKAFLRNEDEPFRRLTGEILQMESHRPAAAWSAEAQRWKQTLEKRKAELKQYLSSEFH